MSEKINWDVLDNMVGSDGKPLACIAMVAEEATIRKDPTKGIHEDVSVPFTKPVCSDDVSAAQWSEIYAAIGPQLAAATVNYAWDLKRRGNVAQVERARLTADPMKKELKTLGSFDFSDVDQNAYVEFRHSGLSAKQALGKLLAG